MSDHRKLRVGMVGGGGPANFFGGPHRTAILMDNSAELTAGALRSSAQGSIDSAKELHFTRGYADYQTLLREEAALPADQRIALVLTHYVGYTAPELAVILNVPTGTVYSRLHYGARAMREALAGSQPPPTAASEPLR